MKSLPTLLQIDSFKGKYSFLSNFFYSPVIYEEMLYPTVEHAYQAAKTEVFKLRETIRGAASPGNAKRLGRKLPLRKDWDFIKVDVMKRLLTQKFSDLILSQWLISTADALLIEGNTWGDRFWGCVKDDQGNWVGENQLGKLLMEVRQELQIKF